MDKSISIGVASCILSIAIGAGIQFAVVMGMITQVNAIYFLIGAGALFLIGIGLLVRGARQEPKTTSSISIVNPQVGTIPKTTNSANHKFVQSIIAEIAGVGIILGGAFVALRNPSEGHITFAALMVLAGVALFVVGVTISTISS